MSKYLLFSLCSCLLFVNECIGQFGKTKYQETVYLNVNSSFLLVGESILFQAYCLNSNSKPSGLSAIVYVELIDESATSVLQTKILMKYGGGSGDFFIPSTLSSGNYTLIAYTNWMKNFPLENFFKRQLTIINPFRKPSSSSSDKSKSKAIEFSPESQLSKANVMDLSLEKKNFKTRELVKIKFHLKDTFSANLSVSVRKIEKKLESSSSDISSAKKTDYTLPWNSISMDSVPVKYLPEVRGNLVTGIVTKKNHLPATGKIVYFSLPAKEYFFYASRTDSSGRFYFNTDKIKSTTDAIIQVDSAACTGCKITLDPPGLNDYSIFKPNELEIDSTFKKLIEQRSLISQIENAYYTQKQDSILDKPTGARFFGQPDKTYRLDDFIRFPTMQDVFIEYLYEVILRKKGERSELKVMDLRKRVVFEKDPLILIDGIPVFDNEKVVSYNPLWVEKIDIVGKHYFYGPLEAYGIISITTYEGVGKNVSSMKREKYIGVQPQKKYFSPSYKIGPSSADRIPDYRVQLYWNPSVNLSKTPVSFDFFTSDIAGDYEVVAEGLQNDGQLIYHREIIHVDN